MLSKCLTFIAGVSFRRFKSARAERIFIFEKTNKVFFKFHKDVINMKWKFQGSQLDKSLFGTRKIDDDIYKKKNYNLSKTRASPPSKGSVNSMCFS